MRKNELSRIDLKFRGRYINKRNMDVGHNFEINNLKEILEIAFTPVYEFSQSVVEIPEDYSRKYQKVGVHSLSKKIERNIEYYHLKLGFVYRDKEPLETIDLDTNELDLIELEGNKYRHIALHLTIIPSQKTIVLDNKCHATPTSFFLRKFLSPFISAADFGIISGQVFENLRVIITPFANDNFEEVLNERFKQLKEIQLTMAKPSKNKLSLLRENEQNSDESETTLEAEGTDVGEVLESIFGKVLGVDTNQIRLDALPIKSVRISVALDEKSGTAPQRISIKSHIKSFLKNHSDNVYMDDALIKYKDPNTGELARALLNTSKLVEICNVNSLEYNNEELMWTEQRRAFTVLRKVT